MHLHLVADNRATALSAIRETHLFVSCSRSHQASTFPQPPNRPVGIGIVECPSGTPRKVIYCVPAYAPSDADAVVDALVRFLQTHPVGLFVVHTSVDLAPRLEAIDANVSLTNARSAYETVSDAIQSGRLRLVIGKPSETAEVRLMARAKAAAKEASSEASDFFENDVKRYEAQRVNLIIGWHQLPA